MPSLMRRESWKTANKLDDFDLGTRGLCQSQAVFQNPRPMADAVGAVPAAGHSLQGLRWTRGLRSIMFLLFPRLLRLLDGVASNPPTSRAPADRVCSAKCATANAILAPIFGKSALQAADLPTRGASLRVHHAASLVAKQRAHPFNVEMDEVLGVLLADAECGATASSLIFSGVVSSSSTTNDRRLPA